MVNLCIRVSEDDKQLIEEKMRLCHMSNFSGFERKMLIDGYVLQVDYSPMKSVAAELNRIGVNINQIVRRIQSTGNVYDEDIREVQKTMDQAWKLLRACMLSMPKNAH